MRRTGVRRRRVRAGLVAAVAALGITAGLSAVGGPAGAGSQRVPVREEAARTYTVRPGDTLWRIAQRFSVPGEDPRPLVDALEAANGVDAGSLVPGSVLVVPSS